ncbi:DER1-domain-containing protein [Linnemannia elongata AG-77]|uniref:Derlin n=1 Tax=Linnemannia elongata AG-77 TaxID=1314771 RepID=A0A197JXI1_9FUNG|nr:DER1-domain-containing protein [Linnemannia elongata AG-77]
MPPILETWYWNIPVVTRLHATGLILVHMCVHFGFVDKYYLYFDPALVFYKHQYWRIATAFLYYGEGGAEIDFESLYTFNMIIFSYYLEREWFSERTVDFVWAYFLSACALLVASTLHTLPFIAVDLHLVFFQVWLLYGNSVGTSKRWIFLSWVFNIGLASITYYYSRYGRFTALAFGALYHLLENVVPTWSISRGVRLFRTPDFVRRLV